MKGKFATGTSLHSLFQRLNPFNQDLSLKPLQERKTILAANANFPFDLQICAYMAAASLEGGSPVIVQFSGQALEVAGRGLGVRGMSRVEALKLGARLARETSDVFAEVYRPPFVALGLDHFAIPYPGSDVGQENHASRGCDGSGPGKGALPSVPVPSRAQIRALLDEASQAACQAGVLLPTKEEVLRWEDYMLSPIYREAVTGFCAAVEELRPAWAMIDTGEMPAVLNFAVTKEVRDILAARGYDAVVEAEYGATGQAGHSEEYVKLDREELFAFARCVAGFVKYTGARGISYPIGMEHAAPAAVKHDPDTERLETVQREILRVTGVYVPFAQHGGTGAKEVERGLVGKNNINTYFLVTQAQYLLGHVLDNRKAIEEGRKAACSSDVYIRTARRVMEAVVEKLKECGTYGIWPDIAA